MLRAVYRVSGTEASVVEKHLIKTARMSRLRFLCCGWQVGGTQNDSTPKYGEYRAGKDRFKVSMASEESVVNKRSHWAEISSFQIEVTYYIDTP